MAKPVQHRGKWRIRWKDERGKRRSEVHAARKDAVYALGQHQAAVAQVQRGLKLGTPPDKPFGELCDYWIENKLPQKRSAKDDTSIIRKHLRPVFGHLLLRDIGIQAVDEFVIARGHLSPKTVSNLLTLLISLLNLAIDLGWLLKAPRIKKPKVRLFSLDYRYLRTAEEVKRFLNAAYGEGSHVYTLYTTAIYTGMREGELAGLERSDVDLEKRLITVQRSFNGPTKAADVRYVPILSPLLPVLREWMLQCPGRLVFPNRAGNMHGESGRVFQEVLHRVLEAAEFPVVHHGGKMQRYIVFHSLRHTFASHWVMNGGDLFKLQKILGHKSTAMTQRYAHLTPDAFVSDYDILGDGGSLSDGKVLAFPGKAANT